MTTERCAYCGERGSKMSKHTPVPWRVIEYSADCFAVVGTGRAICEIEDMDRERGEADARLIAAAPDLLAAARMAIEHLLWGYPFTKEDTEELLRAAINKAEGVADE
jgi:hypothetical protein